MLTLKKPQNIKLALLTLAISLIFFTEPVLAKRGRDQNSKLPAANSSSRQVVNTTSANKIHRLPNANKAGSKTAFTGQSPEPKPMVNTARLRDRGNFRGTVKSNFRQSRRLKSENRMSRTPGTAFDASKHARGSFDASKHARGSFDASKHAQGPFDAGKLAKGRLDARKLAHRNLNSNATFRNRSLFRRPANERSQHTRPATEISQHIRPRNEISQHGATVNRDVTDTRPLTSRHRDRLSSCRITRKWRRPYRLGNDRSRIYNRIVWPRYRRIVYYNHGPYFNFGYLYPYHHRKYIFLSIGGYWPLHYTYLRYYRYGHHPYYWYGSYPTVYEVEGDTYNYYTYNYGSDAAGQVTDYTKPVDENTFADVRERLAAQAAEEPAPETLADQYFEDAVNAFEAGDYDTAADKFARAIDLEPDDIVLPFAYVQALFANQQYSKAVEVLREALSKFPPDTEGLFYPRGLYPDDDILFEQIGRLAAKAELDTSDEDLQLLLGHQLLGAGKLDQATGPLQQIGPDSENTAPAAKLLELLEKIRTENTEDNNQ